MKTQLASIKNPQGYYYYSVRSTWSPDCRVAQRDWDCPFVSRRDLAGMGSLSARPSKSIGLIVRVAVGPRIVRCISFAAG